MRSIVAPSQARGLKRVTRLARRHRTAVAPSQARGLKPGWEGQKPGSAAGRAFIGAWIETGQNRASYLLFPRRAFTGAWIETTHRRLPPTLRACRVFTGAWIETGVCADGRLSRLVAPSRARGLKSPNSLARMPVGARPLRARWIETVATGPLGWAARSRLQGAWIETTSAASLESRSASRAFTGAWI